MPITSKQKPSFVNGIGILHIFQVVSVLIWAVTWWWVTDQTTRMRAQELDLRDLRATLEAVKPFVASDRALLTTINTSVTKQEGTIEQTVVLVREMNTIVQSLSRSQIEFRGALDRMESRNVPRTERSK